MLSKSDVDLFRGVKCSICRLCLAARVALPVASFVSRCLHGFLLVMQTIGVDTSDVAIALLPSALIKHISVHSSDVHQEAVVRPQPLVGSQTVGICVT